MFDIPIFSSLSPITKVFKKRKVIEHPTPKIEAMDLDDFEFDKVILRDVVVLDTLVTYFNEGIFEQPGLKKGTLSSHQK